MSQINCTPLLFSWCSFLTIKKHQMNNETFPAYLAFGKLNQQSIRQQGDQRKADYELMGSK